MKKLLLIIIVIPFALILLTIIPALDSNLFFVPMLAIAFFVGFYLYKQNAKDDEARLKRGIKYIKEDKEAEEWVKTSFAPDTVVYIKSNRWFIIIYSFIFIVIVTFLWSYLTNGLLVAMRNFSYAGILFWSFIMYLLLASYLFEWVEKSLQKKLRHYFKHDWVRGYIFLMPITFFAYVLFPYESLQTELVNKFIFFPLFLSVYTSFFLFMYCVTTLYLHVQEEEKRRVKKAVEKMLKEEKAVR